RTGDSTHYCRARPRLGFSSTRGDRACHPRADSARASDERKNVAAPCDNRECGKTEDAGRRVYRCGRRNARLWLRRHRPALEGQRYRVSRRVPARASGYFDRVKFLVTAGPTRDPIDPVRYNSNRSLGKMGYAIAEAALEAGHDVTLISGPVNLDRPRGAHFISIVTSDEMHDAIHRHLRDCDVLVMCGAVAD